MKKKIALLLAAVMVAAMVPVSAFAKSTNHMTKAVVVEKKTTLSAEKNAPVLKVKYDDAVTATGSFELALEGAEWKITAKEGAKGTTTVYGASSVTDGILNVGGTAKYDVEYPATGYGMSYVPGGFDTYDVVLLDAQTLSVRVGSTHAGFEFPMEAKVTGDTATVTVVPNDTELTAGTYTFATTTSAAASAKVQGVVEVEVEGTAKELKSIIITETVASALKTATTDPGENTITMRLYGDFKFAETSKDSKVPFGSVVSTEATGVLAGTIAYGTTSKGATNYKELVVSLTGSSSTTPAKLSLVGIKVVTDGAEAGDVAEIVVSGAGVAKTTLEVAKAVTYGVSFTVEDKKLPVFYAGRKYANDDTLKVTFKELAEDSWWAARKTTLTFPEGVKVIDVDFTGDVADNKVTWKNNVVTIPGGTYTDTTKKAEWDATFNLSIDPNFVGDITCTVGGPALAEDITVTVAEADYAVTFEVEVSDVSIDYRNVAVGDITIKETFAGALKEDATLRFYLDKIDLEGKAKVEVVEGDIEVEIDDTTNATKNSIELTIKDASYKAASTIVISGVEAYLDRSLPAGSYALKVTEDAKGVDEDGAAKGITTIFCNYNEKDVVKSATMAGWFNVGSYTLADAYIEVVTAGRDQDDATFTTEVAVTIGANTMKVGQGVVALDVPAYISNGYTMLPVRAVADALSADAATVLWDDATKTVTIAFGARIISMTIGSKVMNINGVAIAMTAAPEITNGRTFLPVRDLGYALGLTDADIAWDDATKTATLN